MPKEKADKEIKYSALTASSCNRWMTCHGSVGLNATVPAIPQTEMGHNDEGSRAHRLFELCLRARYEGAKHDPDPIAYIGAPLPDYADTTPVDSDMAHTVATALDVIAAEIEDAGGEYRVFIEYRFTLPELGPDPVTNKVPGGKVDCALYFPAARHVCVYDLKYGQGIAVSSASNQNKYYAAGAINELKLGGMMVDTVSLTVIQPRIYGGAYADDYTPTKAEFSRYDLLEWTMDAAAAADEARGPAPRFVAGEHCRTSYCPAALQNRCKTFQDAALSVASANGQPVSSDADLKYIEDVDADELGRLYALVPMLRGWIKCVSEHAERCAERGKMPTGFAWGKEGNGRRDWAVPDELLFGSVLPALTAQKPECDFIEKRFASVPVVEKALGKKAFKQLSKSGQPLHGLIRKKFPKPKLVPAETLKDNSGGTIESIVDAVDLSDLDLD